MYQLELELLELELGLELELNWIELNNTADKWQEATGNRQIIQMYDTNVWDKWIRQ
jgi:hypothetical protein